MTIVNNFWIAANIIFDLGTGKTSQVLMLVNQPTDATIFPTETEARNYYSFVTNARTSHFVVFGRTYSAKATRVGSRSETIL